MLRFVILFLALSAPVVTSLIGRTQSSGARGVLMCNDRPAGRVVVKLYDDDRGIDADDLMGSTKTDLQGRFEVSGHTSEFTPIDPKLNIYHDCNDGVKPCQRKVTIKIPDRYISSGKTAQKIYEAGTIQLAGKFPGETRDCLH